MKKKLVLIIVLANLVVSFQAAPIQLETGRKLELGREDILFQSISSVLEDGDGNFFVLDAKAFKIYKFSGTGEMLATFGQRGQGPGDLISPHALHLTADGQLAVCNERDFVSIFSLEGAFKVRLRVGRGFGIRYISKNLYYTWRWQPDAQRQVLVDGEGEAVQQFFGVSRDLFSIGVPDETGREVMVNYSRPEYTPGLRFDSNGKLSILGVGDRYDLILLDKSGDQLTRINRDVKPPPLISSEKRYFQEKIRQLSRLFPLAKREFEKKIPDHKNQFDRLLLSKKHLFVFRIRDDVTVAAAPIPVDIFTIPPGIFVGTVKFAHYPLHISEKYIYFVVEEGEELLVVRQEYRITN